MTAASASSGSMATGNAFVDALDALAAEVAQCRASIQAADPAAMTRSVDQAANRAVGAIQAALSGAEQKREAIQQAAAQTAQAASQAAQSVDKVQTATRWLNLRSATVLALAVLLAVGGSLVSLWWQRREVSTLSTQATALRAQIHTERANLAALKAKGGQVKWETCGGHLCFEASSDQHGGWETTKGHIKLVIPRGY